MKRKRGKKLCILDKWAIRTIYSIKMKRESRGTQRDIKLEKIGKMLCQLDFGLDGCYGTRKLFKSQSRTQKKDLI